QVVNDIGGFYSTRVFEFAKGTIVLEKNPLIQAAAIRTLGAYGKKEIRPTLIELLNSDSYHQRLAEAAIAAMRAQDDQSFVAPLRQTLARREAQFNSFGFGVALETLGYLARNLEPKDEVREFLLGHLTDNRERVKVAA